MKRFLNNFLAISSIVLLMLTSCKKSDTLVVTNGGTPGALTASATTLPLDKSKVSDPTTVVTFNFTAPTYTYKAAVTNTIQFDSVGDNWKKPQSVTMPLNVLTQSFNTADFNTILLKLVPAGIASKINVRVQHSLSSTENTYSNVVEMTVTAFNLTSWLYVVGQFNGYSTSTADSLISVTGNGIYKGVVNFPAGQNRFLVLPARNFNNKYATTATPTVTADSISYATEYVSSGGSDLYAPSAAGYYLITLNINTNVISVAPVDYYSVIGSAALGWNATGDDTFMKFVNDGTNTWTATLAMTVGEYKFRQDAAWSKAWGPSSTAGIITDDSPIGDGNIALATAGNYTLTFYMPVTPYGTTPPVTTTYTITKQ
ncbi:SusE domain-containing protein [Mucilaginibacter sp. X5P1]|uniref:SusE domain-containing protein n=1 Tax=Mucilaginibacter sp. X5P1 TaxID=2723088 RepID=UPI00160B0B03|nr:SusE domain-containing protein [Mucilaginibacter sp. X5P1]MBB6139820.1 hypothetical protein [Mucilaginibacter sp. X5P1]